MEVKLEQMEASIKLPIDNKTSVEKVTSEDMRIFSKSLHLKLAQEV